MNRWTVIVSGGMLEEEFARSVLENPEIEFIIGVDRGLEFLYISICNHLLLYYQSSNSTKTKQTS